MIFFDKSPLATAVVTSAMLRTWAVRFEAIELTFSVRSFHVPGDAAHLRLTAELAFGADLARDARHFRGERVELIDHRVDDRREPEELTLQGPSIDVEPHGLQQIAARHRRDRLSDRAGRPQEILDQRVDRAFHRAPGAMRQSQLDALAGLALASDNLADMRQLFRHLLVGGDDLVERVGDLAGEPGAVVGQAHREIAEANGLQRVQYVAQIEIVLGLRPGPPCPFAPSAAMIPVSIGGGGCTSELISASSWADGSMLRSFERQAVDTGAPICITADAIMFCVPLQKCVGRKPRRAASARLGFDASVRRKILIRSISVEQGAAQAMGFVETVVIRPMRPFPCLPSSPVKSTLK